MTTICASLHVKIVDYYHVEARLHYKEAIPVSSDRPCATKRGSSGDAVRLEPRNSSWAQIVLRTGDRSATAKSVAFGF